MRLSLATKVLIHLSISTSVRSYCNWNQCSGVPQGCCDENALVWCNANEAQCEDGCSGTWCTNSFSYCSFRGCTGEIHSTEWCNADQNQCENTCGGEWCTNGNDGALPSPTPPSPTPPSPTPPAPTPTPGVFTATTTRYWDCSGGACGCSYVPTGLSDQEPAHCHSNAMFDAPANNEYGAKYYGAAAISASLGGGNWMAEGCGKCWKVTGTSNAPGYEGVQTTLVLKGTNFCPDDNTLCAAGPHFDIAAPGFDVLQYSFAHECPSREAEEAGGFASCSTWMIHDQNPDANCDCSTFNSPVLRSGCENFYDLKWDNPVVTYEEVTCPVELSRLHCGFPYPNEIGQPAYCESNIEGGTVGPVCGDGVCDMIGGESCSTCEEDCGSCPAVCGDGVCDSNVGEDCSSCAADCGDCCGDGVCDAAGGETCGVCEEDCGACPTTPTPPTPTPPPPTPPAPTPPPPTPPAPTPPPPTPPAPTPPTNGNFCCSNNFKDCMGDLYCDGAEDQCSDCGSQTIWMEEGSCTGLAKWSECTNDRDNCCPPSTCKGGPSYAQCK